MYYTSCIIHFFLEIGGTMDIKVGDLVTRCVGSDRYPYEVIYVSEDLKRICVRQMMVKHSIGYDYYNNQVYDYYHDDNGVAISLSLRKNGRYVEIGECSKSPVYYSFGKAQMYIDPHF